MKQPPPIPDLATLRDPLAAINAAIEIQKANKINQYYPDTGPLRRELYPKHCAVFEAGREYRTRAVIAGNRCITPWTPLEIAGSKGLSMRLCGEVLFESYLDVLSWDGGSRCTRRSSPVFLKGIEQAFLLLVDNGQTFQCSREHQVLTSEGFLTVSQLIRGASGLRCSRTIEDSTASCDTGSYRCGELPRGGSSNVPASLPSQFDAHTRYRNPTWPLDVAALPLEGRHFYPTCDHHSSYDAGYQLADLCGQFEDPTPLSYLLWSKGLRQALLQFRDDLIPVLREQLPGFDRPFGSAVLAWDEQANDAWRTNQKFDNLLQSFRQYRVRCDVLRSGAGFLRDAVRTEMFLPFEHVPLVGGNKILSIIPIGEQPIMDITVPGTSNYFSQGLISHNSGKSEGVGCYETVLHLTGRYPRWWNGHRFNGPIKSWVAGDTSKTVKEILQDKLLGPTGNFGTGMIPKDALVRHTMKAGVADAVDTIYVKHISSPNAVSICNLKSFDQKREAFQGTEQDWILLDEEPDEGIMTECAMRTMATGAFRGGKLLLTFSPVSGWTELVDQFLNEKRRVEAHRFVQTITWDDAPHLTEKEKEEMLREIPEWQRKARVFGVPELGSGAVYPFDEADITVEPFEIPDHWARAGGLDVGGKTAATWLVHDRDTDTIYLVDEYYRENADIAVHAANIKARGDWIPIFCDPAANQSSQIDGRKILALYRSYGLDVHKADNAVEFGITATHNRLANGRMKVFKTCARWLEERRRYRRIKGKVVKDFDHVLDSQRYCLFNDLNNWVPKKLKPIKSSSNTDPFAIYGTGKENANSWMVM